MRGVAAVVVPVITMLLLSACSSAPKRQPVQLVPKVLQPPQLEGEVGAGGRLMLTRVGIEAEALRMSKSISSTMPGTLGLAFYFSVQKRDLILEYQTDEHLYYVAPLDSSLAYSMGSLVLADGDEIGVRVSKKDGSREWYVDNSIFNGRESGAIVWSRPVEDADGVSFTLVKVLLPLKEGNAKFIAFNGVSGNLLHFTYEEIDNDYAISKQYVFRKNAKGPSVVNIEGAELLILEASGDGIHYRAVRGFY